MGNETLELCSLLNKANIEGFKKWLDTMLPTESKLFFSNCFFSFLKIADKLYTGPFGSDRTNFNSEGFKLESQGSELNILFNPNTRMWKIINTDYENNERGIWQSQGWDNLIYQLYDNPMLSWFMADEWRPEDCYIGDQDKYPVKEIEAYWEDL